MWHHYCISTKKINAWPYKHEMNIFQHATSTLNWSGQVCYFHSLGSALQGPHLHLSSSGLTPLTLTTSLVNALRPRSRTLVSLIHASPQGFRLRVSLCPKCLVDPRGTKDWCFISSTDWTVVVKRELSLKADLSFHKIYRLALTYGHERLVMTKRMTLWSDVGQLGGEPTDLPERARGSGHGEERQTC